MSKIRAIKKRIIFVKKTEKMTKAMQMMAAMKFRKADLSLKKNEAYFSTVEQMSQRVARSNFETKNPFFRKKETAHGKELLFVMTSDRSLCGSYNQLIISKVKRLLEGKKTQYDKILIGERGLNYLMFFKNPLFFFNNVGMKVSETFLEDLRDRILNLYPQYDRVWMIFMKASGLKSSVQMKQLLPISEESRVPFSDGVLLCEKNISDVLQQLIREYIFVMLKWVWLEAVVSEEKFRMIAMDSATNNSQEVLRLLSLSYNRLRQASITKEIIEIISGADALNA